MLIKKSIRMDFETKKNIDFIKRTFQISFSEAVRNAVNYYVKAMYRGEFDDFLRFKNKIKGLEDN